MNITACIILGILGLTIGFKIPDISFIIMEYKRSKDNILSIKYSFKKNVFFSLFLTAFNSISWALAGYNNVYTLITLLIIIQITLGLIIVYIDINIRIIPNELVLTILLMGIIFQTISYGLNGVAGSLISMIFIMIVFTAVAGFMGFGKVGAGDVKLAGAIGFALGYPLTLIAMGTMALILLVFIILGLLLKKIKMSTMLPLAPFLVTGYLISLFTLIF